MPQDEIIEQLVKDVEELKRENKRLQNLVPLYKILNDNTPAQITADQNNYALGDYDLLRLSSNTTWTITGLAGGVRGRRVTLYNVGTQIINMAHESASSSAANRMILGNAITHPMNPRDNITFYYDSVSLRWREIAELNE